MIRVNRKNTLKFMIFTPKTVVFCLRPIGNILYQGAHDHVYASVRPLRLLCGGWIRKKGRRDVQRPGRWPLQ